MGDGVTACLTWLHGLRQVAPAELTSLPECVLSLPAVWAAAGMNGTRGSHEKDPARKVHVHGCMLCVALHTRSVQR